MSPRHPAAVYRRRTHRFFGGLIAVLVVLVVVIGSLIARSWSGGAQPSSSPSATSMPTTVPVSSSSTPTPTEEPTAAEETPPADGAVTACEAKDVTVAALADAEAYGAEAQPRLSISLTNNGARDCTLNVGTSTQTFTVTSGEDVWWRSTDCQQNPSDTVVTLTAGATVTSAEPVIWDRTRSSVDSCAAPDRPRAPGGGASYHVAVSIGGFASAETTQFILN